MIHTGDQVTNLDQLQLFYIRPYVRITPYLLGILFGELFLETKIYKKFSAKKEVKIKKEILDINNQNINKSKDKEFEFPLINSSQIIQTNSFLPNDIQNNNNINLIIKEPQNIINSINDEEEDYENSDNIYYKINKYLEENNSMSYFIAFLSFFLLNLVFWNSSISNKGEKELSTFWAAMFQTFGKVLLIFPIGIIIHLTFLDKLIFLRKFLSLKIETQISRQSFGIYVVHLYFLGIFIFGYANNYYIRFLDMGILSFGLFIFSWFFSFVIGLIIESPIVILCKGPSK